MYMHDRKSEPSYERNANLYEYAHAGSRVSSSDLGRLGRVMYAGRSLARVSFSQVAFVAKSNCTNPRIFSPHQCYRDVNDERGGSQLRIVDLASSSSLLEGWRAGEHGTESLTPTHLHDHKRRMSNDSNCHLHKVGLSIYLLASWSGLTCTHE